MNSDETPNLTDPAEIAWVSAQHDRVAQYLASQNCEHAGVSLEPRWFLSPYVAIWAIRSKENPDRIGWWAISGDVPTDYLSRTNEQDNADVLLSFSRAWKAAAVHMTKGMAPPEYRIGTAGHERELAPMLLSRAETLENFARDMKTGGTQDGG